MNASNLSMVPNRVKIHLKENIFDRSGIDRKFNQKIIDFIMKSPLVIFLGGVSNSKPFLSAYDSSVIKNPLKTIANICPSVEKSQNKSFQIKHICVYTNGNVSMSN